MLDGMRRHKGWLKWSLALVCLAFVFLYVPDFFDESGASGLQNSVLARVGRHEITTMEFRRVYLQQVQNYRVQTGEEISEDVLRSLGVHRQVLQQLVNQYSALAEAERLGLEVTDAEIRQSIINLPLFQENGHFVGEERYRQALQFQRPPVTTAQFEEEIRRELLVRRLQSAITGWVGVTDEELEAEYRRRNERVSVNVVTFRGDDFRDVVEATDSDVELLYDEESLTYEVPERRQLRFLLIDESAIGDSITLTDAEVQDYYDANFSRFSRPGQVRASHILLRTEDQDEAAVEARAAELAAEARAGADFAELARAHSDDEGTAVQGGDLGLFARGRMVPEFEAVAFELEVGAISDPVRSAFGFHVITVTEKQEAATQPLAEVRDLIERTIKQEQAAIRSSALANAIAEEVSTPADLDTAASSRGLEVQESGLSPRASRSSDWGWPHRSLRGHSSSPRVRWPAQFGRRWDQRGSPWWVDRIPMCRRSMTCASRCARTFCGARRSPRPNSARPKRSMCSRRLTTSRLLPARRVGLWAPVNHSLGRDVPGGWRECCGRSPRLFASSRWGQRCHRGWKRGGDYPGRRASRRRSCRVRRRERRARN